MTEDGLDNAVKFAAQRLGFVGGQDDDYIAELRNLMRSGHWTLEDLQVYFQLPAARREEIRG